MTRLGTTTHMNRNDAGIQSAMHWAEKRGIAPLEILDIGPGGQVAFLSGRGKQGGNWHKCPVFVESAIRKTGMFRLKSFEPSEILAAFSSLTPKSMHILDKEQKVIASIRKEMEASGSPLQFEFSVCRIEEFSPCKKFDIVFAYHVIERMGDWRAALSMISDLVKVNGLLSMTDYGKQALRKDLTGGNVENGLPMFTKLDGTTYVRNA